MRAVVLEEFGKMPSVQEVELFALQPYEVRVETGASGVCGSDLSTLRGQYSYPLPLVLGHEGAGTVVEVGSEVNLVKPGDRVIASWRPNCGVCWQCVRGRQHLCETTLEIEAHTKGMFGDQILHASVGLGTMSELMTIHERNVVKVDTDLPDEQLALIGCGVTTGAGSALWTAKVEPGSTVAVFGAGGVGVSVIQGARIAGAAQIICVETSAEKRAMALTFGATDVVDPAESDPVEQIRALTEGRGVEYSFEAVGLLTTMQQAYRAAARGCAVIFVGAMGHDLMVELPANDLHAEGKQILGSIYGSAQVRRDMPRLVALVEAGKLDVGNMISRRLPLEGIGEALEALQQAQGIRSLLIP